MKLRSTGAPNQQASGSHAPQDTFKLTAGSAPGSALNRFNKSVTEFMLTDGNAYVLHGLWLIQQASHTAVLLILYHVHNITRCLMAPKIR